MNTIDLRRASPFDSDALWNLRTSSIAAIETSFYRAEDLSAWANRSQFSEFKDVISENFYIVAILKDQIIGGGFLDLKQRSIEAMYVQPEFKRRGVGKLILKSLISEARSQEWKEISLSSTLNAVPFYQSSGFEKLGRSKYKWNDGLEMECELMKLTFETNSFTQPNLSGSHEIKSS